MTVRIRRLVSETVDELKERGSNLVKMTEHTKHLECQF